MKKKAVAIGMVVVLCLVAVSVIYAQYPAPWYTAYQVVNMSNEPANIMIDYYDDAGNKMAASKVFSDVPPGGSRLVVQFTDDPNLPDGRYSAVVSADREIAAVVNQQLVPASSANYSPIPPFSSYGGESAGATKITLPAVMYNWYGYYTDIFVMNAGSGDAADVDITYVPGVMDVGRGPEPTGAAGVTELNNAIRQYATLLKSQKGMTTLGAPSGSFQGRFLGSAIITADQPIVAVVNQHNPDAYKLMTYNGFTRGAKKVAVPAYMRGFFGYYTTLLVANPSDSVTAQVAITYTPNPTAGYNEAEPGSTIAPFTVNFEIAPQTALTRYDGPGASDGQSDLDDAPHAYKRFFGSILVESDVDVMVMVNVEALATGDDQAGAYNGIPTDEATTDVVVPVIAADFYGYYTTLTVQNTTNTAGSCDITYASDGIYSAVKNQSKTYAHSLPANGSLAVYEGRKGGQEVGDINHDLFWRLGGNKQFLGAASIHCTVPVVAFVNEESDVLQRDSMYTFNTFNR